MTLNNKIDRIMNDISKQYGEGSAMILGETKTLDINRVSSGSLNLDLALGGGIPTGRTVEVFGPESAGKTTVSLLYARELQQVEPEKYILFIDLEHAIDPALVESYGIDISKFIISQPDTGEQALNIVESFMRSGVISCAIIDSVSALLPEAEAKGEMQDQQMGLQARLMGKALRKLTPPASEYNCTVIFINQIREKVGILYGNPETTSGGRALTFYASIRINVRAGERIPNPNNKDEVIGHIVNARVVKNKTALPFKKASFELLYGKGVDRISEIADISIIAEYVNRAGAYYQIKNSEDEKIVRTVTPAFANLIEEEKLAKKISDNQVELSFMGKEKFVEYLKLDTHLFEIMETAIREGIAPSEEDLRAIHEDTDEEQTDLSE